MTEPLSGVCISVHLQPAREDALAVSEEWRGQGIGTQLLHAVEDEGRRRGCTNVWLDTFSFQAQPFYERAGYHVFGVLADFPPGETRYFMTKSLVGD